MQKKAKSAAKGNYTVLFVPEDNRRTFTMEVRSSMLRLLVGVVVFFVAGVAVLVYLAGDIAVRLQLVHTLRVENQRLRKDNRKLADIVSRVENIERMNAYLRRLALATGAETALAVQPELGLEEEAYANDGMEDAVEEIGVYADDESSDVRETAKTPGEALDAVPYIRPVEGWITRGFTADSGGVGGHSGVDYAAPVGAHIIATASGVVEAVLNDRHYGKTVVLKHGGGFVTRYCHCQRILVNEGDDIRRGQTIALVGNTGTSSAPHLHYEVIRGGRVIDPLRYIMSYHQ